MSGSLILLKHSQGIGSTQCIDSSDSSRSYSISSSLITSCAVGLCVGAALLQPSLTRFDVGFDAEACRRWKSGRRQEMGVGAPMLCQCPCWEMSSEILDQTAESEYVGYSRDCRPDVSCQIGNRGFQERDSVSKGEGNRS